MEKFAERNINFSEKEVEGKINAVKFLEWLFEKKNPEHFIEVSRECKFSKYAKTAKDAVLTARNWVEEVYFGVNPRCRIPNTKSKRASAKDVAECVALCLDFDFKHEVRDVPKEIERELKEIGYVKRNGVEWIRYGEKIFRIEKPSYEEFVKMLEPKLQEIGLDLDYVSIVDSGYGYHVYMRLQQPISPEKWRKLQEKLIKHFGSDEKIKNPDRLVRFPDTFNRRFGLRRMCKVLKIAEKDVDADELLSKLKTIVKDETKEVKEVKGEEKDEIFEKAQKIVEILKDYYHKGFRNQIITGLAGLLRKANWNLEDAEKLVRIVCEQLGDEETESNRIPAVKSTFRKEPKDVSFRQLVESVKTILIDERGFDKDEATKQAQEVFEKIAEIVGYDTSYVKVKVKEIKREVTGRDGEIHTVFTTTYFVNGSLTGIVSVTESGTSKEVKVISPWYISEVTEFVIHKFVRNEIEYRYTVKFVNKDTNDERVYENMRIDEIKKEAIRDGLAFNMRLFEEALSAIINEFKVKGKCKTKETAGAVGWFEFKGKLKWFNPPNSKVKIEIPENTEFSLSEVNKALNILTEIVKFYDENEAIRALICIGFIAPFNFIRKQHGIEQKHKILYGEPHTGKTSICKVITAMWGGAEKLSRSGYVSIPQLSEFISMTTLPFVFDEAKTMLEKEEVIEILKQITKHEIAREIIVDPRSRKTLTFPAYANLFFTMNKLPEEAKFEPFLAERTYLFYFSPEMKKEGKGEEFWYKIERKMDKLSAIGKFITAMINALNDYANKYEKVDETLDKIRKIIFDHSLEEWEAGRRLMLTLCEFFNYLVEKEEEEIKIPSWLKNEIKYDYRELIEEEKIDPVKEFVLWLKEKLNREIAITVGKEFVELSFVEKIEKLRQAGSWIADVITISKDKSTVHLAKEIFDRFVNERRLDVSSKLSEWATRLGGEVKVTMIKGKSKRVVSVPLDKFIEIFEGEEKETGVGGNFLINFLID